MNLTLNLTPTDNPRDIERQIVRALNNELSVAMRRAANIATPKIKELVKRTILSQPEVESLINGKLRDEFGIPDAREKLDAIIENWASNTVVLTKQKRTSTKFDYGFTIQMIQSDYQDVLNDQAAFVQIVGGALPWLKWLLLEGDNVIVRDYDVEFLPSRTKRSRTGMAVMVKGPNRQWGVPPEYAGDADNNFVTRAIDQIDTEVLDIMEESLKQAL